MRKEIDNIASIIAGYIKRDSCIAVNEEKIFSNDVCEWRVSVNVPFEHSRQSSVIHIDCHIKLPGVSSMELGYSFSGSVSLKTENAQSVYESLDVFVEGMLAWFPFLEKSLEPLVKASEVTF